MKSKIRYNYEMKNPLDGSRTDMRRQKKEVVNMKINQQKLSKLKKERNRRKTDRQSKISGTTSSVPMYVCVCTQSSLTLYGPMDCSLPGSSAHGIFSRQKHLSGLSFPIPGDRPNPGVKPTSLCLLHCQADSLPVVPPGKPCVFQQKYQTEKETKQTFF